MPDLSYDGVFVWNCFEQVPDPRPLFKEVHRVVKPSGVLIVRMPNAVFYELCESLLRGSATLDQLISNAGFHSIGALNFELITLPLREVPAVVDEEERAIALGIERMNRTARTCAADGTWVELYYRVDP